MPKSQFVDPNEVRKSGWIKFHDIPVNQYSKTIEEEKANFSKEDFLRIFRDMAIIREFETMLTSIKRQASTTVFNTAIQALLISPSDRRPQPLGRPISWTRTISFSDPTGAMEKFSQRAYPQLKN